MTQNRFAFLVDRPTIPQGSYGAVTDYALQQAIPARRASMRSRRSTPTSP